MFGVAIELLQRIDTRNISMQVYGAAAGLTEVRMVRREAVTLRDVNMFSADLSYILDYSWKS